MCQRKCHTGVTCANHDAYALLLRHYTTRFNEVERGVYWYHLVRLSVCPSVDRIVSALYLQQYSSDPFHICTSYLATSEGVSRVMPISKFKHLKFWRFFLICNFNFVFFWLPVQHTVGPLDDSPGTLTLRMETLRKLFFYDQISKTSWVTIYPQ